MPEALAVLFVFVLAVASYVGAKIHAANPANYSRPAEISRLQQRQAWLQSRLRLARREDWDREMVARLTDELAATTAELEVTESIKAKAV